MFHVVNVNPFVAVAALDIMLFQAFVADFVSVLRFGNFIGVQPFAAPGTLNHFPDSEVFRSPVRFTRNNFISIV
jgi:hypothetical protein